MNRSYPSATRLLGLAGLCCFLAPTALEGQRPPTIGVVLGRTTSNQRWEPRLSTTKRNGILIGGFAEVVLPGGRGSLRVEAAYVQRGAIIERDREGVPVDGEIRSEYLSFPIHVKLSKAIGPLRVHVAGGPTIDQLFRSKLDPVLAQVLDEERATSVGIALAAGVSVEISERLIPEFEVRLTEGLSHAYAGSFTSVRNRSLELVLRVGMLRTPN